MAESMQGLKRTHRCGELSAANAGEKVTIMGWVQKNRNKGGLVFVDVRDRSGIIQVVCEEGKTDAAPTGSLPPLLLPSSRTSSRISSESCILPARSPEDNSSPSFRICPAS